ncbi:LuxR family transcriptional regulator [Sinorhizobium medicae]|uniref:LuxR family transcriptional regulator n=1 Tax=Sinorhizobium medicae TaxID=110321 RepID=UPI00129610F0|nr:LuxR family transcriptional regulator [Sinorhizobium medicae]MDX1017412.1 LuxR family transcriptional regulator [Sinorhizobium medicae]MDX2388467.1 LuxR family transcriptional regulator [Sinorhizobium medicae]MQU79128.1 LuxR family transcriptional regulator [Sinorhizobium medicae]
MKRQRMPSLSQARVPQQVSLAPSMFFQETVKEAFAVDLGHFLEQTDGVARSEQLFEFLSAFAINFDFPWMAYSPCSADRRLDPAQRNKALVSYPDEWQEHYARRGYDRINPIIKKSRKQAGAFRWDEVYSDAATTEVERRFFDEAAAFGLKSGISIPLHGPNSSFAIMSFARPSCSEIQTKTIAYLHFAALHFHVRVACVDHHNSGVTHPTLSRRETECIYWVARGKSSWDIGRILDISQNTVNFHLKNIMRKMDATSRTVAAIKAASLGIIDL